MNHAEFVAKKFRFESEARLEEQAAVNGKRIQKKGDPYEAEEIVNHQESTQSNCEANPALINFF